MTSDVYLVLLEFGQQHERAALELLMPALGRIFPAAHVRGAIVDNALSAATEVNVDADLHRVSGDNTLREFSGWDCGLAWLERRYTPNPDSIIVLANDTIVRVDKRPRLRDCPVDRADAASRGALVGYVEAYPRPITLFGETLRQWVDTSFVIASYGTLAELRPLARPIASDDLFDDPSALRQAQGRPEQGRGTPGSGSPRAESRGDWRSVFREPSPLSENYRAYLRTWLTGEQIDDEFDQTWHAREPLTEATFDRFKAKVRSFVCEHLLSAYARRRGIPLVDIRSEPLPIDP